MKRSGTTLENLNKFYGAHQLSIARKYIWPARALPSILAPKIMGRAYKTVRKLNNLNRKNCNCCTKNFPPLKDESI